MCLHCQCLGVECRISIVRALTPVIMHCSLGYCYVFIAHQQRSMLMRDIDTANLSVCPSVRYFPVPDENGLTYRHSFFHHTVAQSL